MAATANKSVDIMRLRDVDALTSEIVISEMATPSTLAGQTQNDGSYRIAFEHNNFKWLITFPAEFPDKPAEVYRQESRYGAGLRKLIIFQTPNMHKSRWFHQILLC